MAPPGLRVRPLTGADIPAVAALERRAFEASWPATAFERELTANRLARYVVLESVAPAGGAVIVGFGGLWTMADQAHIVSVAVEPGERGRGLGRLIVHALLTLAQQLGMTDATLEVRVSNEAAGALYRRAGFHTVARRKRYYDDGEDAAIMTTEPFDSAGFQGRFAAGREFITAHLQEATLDLDPEAMGS